MEAAVGPLRAQARAVLQNQAPLAPRSGHAGRAGHGPGHRAGAARTGPAGADAGAAGKTLHAARRRRPPALSATTCSACCRPSWSCACSPRWACWTRCAPHTQVRHEQASLSRRRRRHGRWRAGRGLGGGAGHLPPAQGNPLALGMTLLIGAFYAWGVLELWRFHQATLGLAARAGPHSAPPDALHDWLAAGARRRCAAPCASAWKTSAARCPAPRSRPTWPACWCCWACWAPSWAWWSRSTAPAWRWSAPPTCRPCAIRSPRPCAAWAWPSAPRWPAWPPRPCWGWCRRCAAARAPPWRWRWKATSPGSLQGFTRAHQRRQQQEEQQRLQRAAAALQQATLALQQQQAEQLPQLVASLQALAVSVGHSVQNSLAEGARQAAATLATLQPAVQTTVQATMAASRAKPRRCTGTSPPAVQQQLDGLAQRFEAQATAGWAMPGRAGAGADRRAAADAWRTPRRASRRSKTASDEARAWPPSAAALSQHGPRALEQNNAALGTQLEAAGPAHHRRSGAAWRTPPARRRAPPPRW